MKFRHLILLLLLLSGTGNAQIPVILRVSAAEQSDTTGCNFVRELTRITYDAILSGKAKLWNSPTHEIQIMGSSLKEIERTSGTLFTEQEVVFIYEYWTNQNKELKSTTSGFLFANKTKLGDEVEYGYVEYNDLQEFFMRERVRTNANGNFNANLASYLSSKNYNYNFLQFAGKVIDNVTDSRKIRDDFIGGLKFNISAFAMNEVPQKMVTWTLDLSTDVSMLKSANGNLLLSSIEKFLRGNEEVFYNLGGDQILNHIQKGKWKVNKIEVNELWKKISGQVMFDPTEVVIYINDKPLLPIPYRDLVKMEVKVEELGWVDFIRLKNFNYVIRKINSQEIVRSEAYMYQKAFFEADWNKINGYAAGQ
jgi:hypothetical protein